MKRILQKFENRTDLPIEIEEIRDFIVELGIQDRIIFCAEDLDTAILRGVIYQWRQPSSVYGEPIWTTLIVYPCSMAPDWQRAICAKEMVHIFDSQIVKTVNPEMIEGLAKKVVGPLEIDAESPESLMATVDRLAEFQAVNLLFPRAARTLAHTKISSNEMTVREISEWASIPEHFVQLALDPKWEDISSILDSLSSS